MTAFVIFDVEVRDPVRYQEFMDQVKPALIAAGATYLARGGALKVYEGDWRPRRIVILQFPSVAAFETFYEGPTYQGLKAIRELLQFSAPCQRRSGGLTPFAPPRKKERRL